MTRREISNRHVCELSSVDTSDYWWYAVRQAHVEAALRAEARDRSLRYLDLGCGTGGVMQSVIASLAPREALGLDGTQQAIDVAQSRGLAVRYADLRHPLALPFAPNAITCLDVLEHLEHPVTALAHLFDAAAADALLVVTVPAMPSLYGRWDEVCGHHRRYTRALLARHLSEGRWRPQRVRFIFSYCVPPAWLQRRVLGRVQEMEFPPVTPLANRLLTWAGRVERSLGAHLPLGMSLLAIARRALR